MNNIIFSLDNIKSLIENNQLTIEDVLEQFERDDLINSTRYIYSAGYKWGIWYEVSSLINEFLEEQEYEFIPRNTTFDSNIAYFSSRIYLNYFKDNMEHINCFNLKEINFIFSKHEIVNSIYNFITKNTIRNIEFNPLICIQFPFACLGKKVITTVDEEINLLNILLSRNIYDDSKASKLVSSLLKKRLNNLQISIKHNRTTLSKNNLALLITGQLRGYEESLKLLNEKLNNFNEIDVFLSTWSNIGRTRLNWQNAYRIFEEDALNLLLEYKDDIDLSGIEAKLDASLIMGYDDILKSLKSILTNAKSIRIHVKNDKEYPFNRMNNSEKMYYHNIFWIETLGSDFFNKYDHMMKVRADCLYSNNDQIIIDDENSQPMVFTDASGWLFEEWGFGIADQVWFGNTNNIIPLMKTHIVENDAYLIKRDIYNHREVYSGHTNCAIEAWSNGKIISNDYYPKKGLSDTKKVTMLELKKILQVKEGKQ